MKAVRKETVLLILLVIVLIISLLMAGYSNRGLKHIEASTIIVIDEAAGLYCRQNFQDGILRTETCVPLKDTTYPQG